MSSVCIDPLGDSLSAEPDGDTRTRMASWIRNLQSLAEEVRDDPELTAALTRQIRRAEEQLATLARERDHGPYGPSVMSGLSINPWG